MIQTDSDRVVGMCLSTLPLFQMCWKGGASVVAASVCKLIACWVTGEFLTDWMRERERRGREREKEREVNGEGTWIEKLSIALHSRNMWYSEKKDKPYAGTTVQVRVMQEHSHFLLSLSFCFGLLQASFSNFLVGVKNVCGILYVSSPFYLNYFSGCRLIFRI